MLTLFLTGVTKTAEGEDEWAHEECDPASLLSDRCFH